MQNSFEEQERKEEQEFLNTLTPFQRMVDNVWYFVPGTLVLWVLSFDIGILIGIFL